MEQHLKYIADKIKEIEEYAADRHKTTWWDEYLDDVQLKVDEVTKYARENNIPIVLDAEAIAERNYEGDRSEYFESSSSYYEESDYEEEEESSNY